MATHFELPLKLAESAINQALRLDSYTRQRLQAFIGKVIAVEPDGLGLCIYLIPQESGIHLASHYDGAVNVWLRGGVFSLSRLLAKEDSRLFSSGDVRLEGEAGLAQRFSATLRGLEIDWEELLAKAWGDAPAHQAGQLWRKGRRWGLDNVDTARQNLSEYMQEEIRVCPPAAEIAAFMDEVDEARAGVERLEQRIDRLLGLAAKYTLPG
jgi:ubiquinone biosynthesis protein UbiJ